MFLPGSVHGAPATHVTSPELAWSFWQPLTYQEFALHAVALKSRQLNSSSATISRDRNNHDMNNNRGYLGYYNHPLYQQYQQVLTTSDRLLQLQVSKSMLPSQDDSRLGDMSQISDSRRVLCVASGIQDDNLSPRSPDSNRCYSPGDLESVENNTCDANTPLNRLSQLSPGEMRKRMTVSPRPRSRNRLRSRDRGGPRHDRTLKFGVDTILSSEFGGKARHNKDKLTPEVDDTYQRQAQLESHYNGTPLPVCHPAFYPLSATTYDYPSFLATRYAIRYPSSSLSAVHSLQPPHYPIPAGTDSLPGPYSILSTDAPSGGQSKRKRSWSRAVFSQLQRKGLEKRFEIQKYVTKPDRRKLAAVLGLTDSQVKVWFQNRRMKWRHAEKQIQQETTPSSNSEKSRQKPEAELISQSSDVTDNYQSDDEHVSTKESISITKNVELTSTIAAS